MKVLLVGMYPADQQYSLQGFAGALKSGLSLRGCDVRLISPRVALGRAKIPRMGKWLGHADKFVLFPQELKRAAAWADVVHLVDHGHAIYVKHLPHVPHIITCHDLIAAKAAFGELPEWALMGTARVYQQMILDGLRQAGHVACISEATRQDVLRMAHVPDTQTSLIYDALFYPYRPMPGDESTPVVKTLGLESDAMFFIHIGRDVPTKNRDGLVKIFRVLREQCGMARAKLVLAGKPLTQEMRQFIREQGVEDGVLELSHLSNEHLRALYSRAQALIFPSLCEGFGLPIIEAQACGCPVFTSNRAPMTEVGGTAAVYFDPTQPDHAAQIIAGNLDAREEQITAGFENVKRFTTERMVDEYLHLYQSLTNSPHER